MPNNNKLIPFLTDYIWFNGQFIHGQDAKIHVLTHSLHYSGSVFEGEKAVNGKIFQLEKHTNRLFNSALQMKLNIPYNKDEIMKASIEVLRKNCLSDAYIRPLVWRNSDRLLICPTNFTTNVMIAAWAPSKKVTDNLNLTISQWRKSSPDMMPVQCKSSMQYAMMTLVGLEAREQGFDDAILLDNKNCITECTSSNIFFIKNNKLFTPTTRNCLNGITRQAIIAIAQQENIDIIEEDITLENIPSIDSAFTTGTAGGIRIVNSITFHNQTRQLINSELIRILKINYEKLLQNE